VKAGSGAAAGGRTGCSGAHVYAKPLFFAGSVRQVTVLVLGRTSPYSASPSGGISVCHRHYPRPHVPGVPAFQRRACSSGASSPRRKRHRHECLRLSNGKRRPPAQVDSHAATPTRASPRPAACHRTRQKKRRGGSALFTPSAASARNARCRAPPVPAPRRQAAGSREAPVAARLPAAAAALASPVRPPAPA